MSLGRGTVGRVGYQPARLGPTQGTGLEERLAADLKIQCDSFFFLPSSSRAVVWALQLSRLLSTTARVSWHEEMKTVFKEVTAASYVMKIQTIRVVDAGTVP